MNVFIVIRNTDEENQDEYVKKYQSFVKKYRKYFNPCDFFRIKYDHGHTISDFIRKGSFDHVFIETNFGNKFNEEKFFEHFGNTVLCRIKYDVVKSLVFFDLRTKVREREKIKKIEYD